MENGDPQFTGDSGPAPSDSRPHGTDTGRRNRFRGGKGSIERRLARLVFTLSRPETVLRAVLLFCLVGIICGDGFFRIPGIEKDQGIVGLLLSAARGIVIYGTRYGVWPALVLYFIVRERRVARLHWVSLLPVVLLAMYLAVSVAVSGVPEVVAWRGRYFLTAVLPASACMLMCIDRRSLEAVPVWLVGAAGVAVVIIVLSGKLMPILLADGETLDAITSSVSSVTVPGRLVLQSDPITSATIFFVAALSGIFLMRDAKRWVVRFALLGIVSLSIWFGLLSGARGPLISFLVAVGALYGFARLRLARKILGFLAGASVLSAGLWLLPQVSEVSAVRVFGVLGTVDARLDRYGSSEEVREGSGRRDLYQFALASPVTVFGRGIGSFARDRRDVKEYAHNLFLEAHYELGALGIFAILAVCLSCLARLLRLARGGNRSALFCLIALGFFFTQSQFSGTLLMNTGLWAFLVLGHMVIAVERTDLRLRRRTTIGSAEAVRPSAALPGSNINTLGRPASTQGTSL